MKFELMKSSAGFLKTTNEITKFFFNLKLLFKPPLKISTFRIYNIKNAFSFPSFTHHGFIHITLSNSKYRFQYFHQNIWDCDSHSFINW